jgi:hypothetical protein
MAHLFSVIKTIFSVIVGKQRKAFTATISTRQDFFSGAARLSSSAVQFPKLGEVAPL